MRYRRQHHVYVRGRRATAEMERVRKRAEVRRQRGLVVWLCVLALASGCAWLALGGGL